MVWRSVLLWHAPGRDRWRGRGVNTAPDAAVAVLRFVSVHQSDPLAAPLLDELSSEYHARYDGLLAPEYRDLRAYPAEEFEAPGGAFVVALYDGVAVAGGAFRQ